MKAPSRPLLRRRLAFPRPHLLQGTDVFAYVGRDCFKVTIMEAAQERLHLMPKLARLAE